MPSIISVSTFNPPHTLDQETTTEFARELFNEDFQDIERLLKVFQNGQIEERHFAVPIEWFEQDHSLKEKNDLYIKLATSFSTEAIKKCLINDHFLKKSIDIKNIDAIVLVSSSGMSTPSLDARIMNNLPFTSHTKRIPLWGLGCAGGAAGISRAYEYCRAYPEENVLVVCVELCSLTFQRNDRSKSNLVGTSLFADGIACAVIAGDGSSLISHLKTPIRPTIVATQSTLMPNSEDVMGWDVKDSGLHVVFSRDIPTIIKEWLEPNVTGFLNKQDISIEQLSAFIAHPGGKKVLEAYKDTLQISERLLKQSKEILRKHGNMSSPTVLYVLEKIMLEQHNDGDYGLMAALGPGFCSELVLVTWKGVH
ncbi:type III polyketide synthase [Halalkalibacter krulwichiae]|uniref:Alpha-pyrone synthesis polyketide synthase-like Pks11 n=1 Tax=Halalkalibacter krulwichiae TaxID=199441 RepID=A0A1X9M7P1_9BACI|nr:3-oxoacyl-[acyl-carrier-protein] synthase III C-terminal domain-containing protein [Halalkalibacter krulwichiae]ARK28694.1 Alpha-pyrone synthesis polyketide synthase-like Pks11 [Halalkalibacter krulwichiae]